MTNMEALQTLQEWVDQYKNDDAPLRIAQTAAIAAMDQMLKAFRHGLDKTSIRAGLAETHRMMEILNAFQGRLALLEMQRDPG